MPVATELSQNERILRYLRSGQSITQAGALKLCGSSRLAARIWELRTRPPYWDIRDDWIKIACGRVKSYWLRQGRSQDRRSFSEREATYETCGVAD